MTWKLPLFQLVSRFPRPPLGFSVEVATILHLLGDPVDSVMSMLLTLSICRSTVELAKKTCSKVKMDAADPDYDRTWKALALFMVSYDDCGKAESVGQFCRD